MSDINRLNRKYTKQELVEMINANDAELDNLKAILATMAERGHALPAHEQLIEDVKGIHERAKKMIDYGGG